MDLIDRSEVQYKMAEILPEADSLEWYEQARPDEVKDLVDELYNIVLNVNRIDAQPVKRGKWVDYGSGVGMYCSECRHRIRYRNGIRETTTFSDGEFNFAQYASKNGYYNFCPKCGAKMEG
jgi:hypothetical protein